MDSILFASVDSTSEKHLPLTMFLKLLTLLVLSMFITSRPIPYIISDLFVLRSEPTSVI